MSDGIPCVFMLRGKNYAYRRLAILPSIGEQVILSDMKLYRVRSVTHQLAGRSIDPDPHKVQIDIVPVRSPKESAS